MIKAIKLVNVRFTIYLGIISILGYLSILIQSAFGVDITNWINSFLFFLIGLSLFISGGWNLIFGYFKGGLTVSELNKMVAVVVGFFSMLTGILTLPLFGINLDIIDGFKIIISVIAILVISSQLLFEIKRNK